MHLSLSAEEQAAFLDREFRSLTGGGDASAYGNDELVELFCDIALAIPHLISINQLTQVEAEAVQRFDTRLNEVCDPQDSAFWMRPALFEDPRWEEIRIAAREALERLPNEPRNEEQVG